MSKLGSNRRTHQTVATPYLRLVRTTKYQQPIIQYQKASLLTFVAVEHLGLQARSARFSLDRSSSTWRALVSQEVQGLKSKETRDYVYIQTVFGEFRVWDS